MMLYDDYCHQPLAKRQKNSLQKNQFPRSCSNTTLAFKTSNRELLKTVFLYALSK